MAIILVPNQMPDDLQDRDETERLPVQTAQSVHASSLSRPEDAIAHLAAARPLSAPASVRRVTLTTSYQSFQTRIAMPLVPHQARVHGVIVAEGKDIIDIRATTDHISPTYVTPATIVVGAGSVGVPLEFDFDVDIGAGGAITAAASSFVDVTFEAKKRSTYGAVNVYLHGWGVALLPFYAPYASPAEVTS